MPQLLAFLACEKVLWNSKDNQEGPTLIACLDRVTVNVASPPDPKTKPRVPLLWNVAVMWKWEPNDDGKLFTQRIKLITPSGDIATDVTGQMQRPANARRAFTNVTTDGFPVGEPGEYTVLLEFREGDGEWKELAKYPIEVVYELTGAKT